MIRKTIFISCCIMMFSCVVPGVVSIWRPLTATGVDSSARLIGFRWESFAFNLIWCSAIDQIVFENSPEGAGVLMRQYDPRKWGLITYSSMDCHQTQRLDWDGSSIGLGNGTLSYRCRFISCPLWMPAVFFAVVALAAIRKPYLQRYRRRRGCCLHCGYDLQGNVSGVCPECGASAENDA